MSVRKDIQFHLFSEGNDDLDGNREFIDQFLQLLSVCYF